MRYVNDTAPCDLQVFICRNPLQLRDAGYAVHPVIYRCLFIGMHYKQCRGEWKLARVASTVSVHSYWKKKRSCVRWRSSLVILEKGISILSRG